MDPGELLHEWNRAMQIAVSKGDIAMTQHIHQNHPEPLGSRIFRVTAYWGHLELLKWLLEHRWDGLCCLQPPIQYEKGTLSCCLRPILVEAVSKGHGDIVKFLLHAKYVDFRDGFGDVAVRSGDVQMAEWFYRRYSSRAFSSLAYSTAVEKGHLEIVHERTKITKPRDVNLLDVANANGHEEMTEYLRANGICTTISPDIVVRA